MDKTRRRWVQRELQLRLMLPVLLIVGLAGLFGAYEGQQVVNRVFDRWLLDGAQSLAQQVRFEGGRAIVDLPRQAQQMLLYDAVDRVNFEVVQGEEHLIGERGVPLRPMQGRVAVRQSDGTRTYDAEFGGAQVRVASVPVIGPDGERATVLMSETTIKRQRARRDLLLMILPLASLPLFAALVIALAVRSTIAPLEGIAKRWNERSQESLEPLPAAELPRELLPFAAAFNALLARLRSTLERERQLAATAAHQLRTPLTGLQLGVARAAEAPDLQQARAILDEVGRTTQRAARLVQQVLALGRLDPELRTGLELVEVDLVPLAREVGESYLDAALEKGLDLEFTSELASLAARGQPDLLSEALGNLIDNAIRYTPRGGTVEISVRCDADSAWLEVSDSGPGVPAHERERLFQRFVRGSSADAGGSGLGLAIVKEIASLHGAQARIDQSLLGGARVTIRFARDAGAAPAILERDDGAPPQEFTFHA